MSPAADVNSFSADVPAKVGGRILLLNGFDSETHVLVRQMSPRAERVASSRSSESSEPASATSITAGGTIVRAGHRSYEARTPPPRQLAF